MLKFLQLRNQKNPKHELIVSRSSVSILYHESRKGRENSFQMLSPAVLFLYNSMI